MASESELETKFDKEVLFRTDKEMFDKLPTKRARSAFCRKSVEILLNLLNSPNQKEILGMMGYNSLNIFDRVTITPHDPPTPVNSEELKQAKEDSELLLKCLKTIIVDLFMKVNNMFTVHKEPTDTEPEDWYLSYNLWQEYIKANIDQTFIDQVMQKFKIGGNV